MSTPIDLHFSLVKRILRYLEGTMHCGLTFSAATSMQLTAYSDSDWASDVNTRRSTTSFVVFLGPNPISWRQRNKGVFPEVQQKQNIKHWLMLLLM